jgi:N-acetylneuraminic acid mutarotase
MRRTRQVMVRLLVVVGLVAATALLSAGPAAAASWATGAPLPSPRVRLTAVSDRNGYVYAIGGEDPVTGQVVATVLRYNPSTNRWRTVTPMPVARTAAVAVRGDDGRLYVFGGRNAASQPLNLTEAYDPSTGAWTRLAAMPTARWSAAAAKASDGRIYVIGGCCGGGSEPELPTVEAYDPSTNRWSTRASIPVVGISSAAAVAANKRVYVFGGAISGDSRPLVQVYNPATNSWKFDYGMPTSRQAHGARPGANGRIYVFGGFGEDDQFLGSVDVYRPDTNTWEPGPAMPTARAYLGSAVRGTTIYALGGLGSFTSTSTTTSSKNEILTTP